MKIFLAIVCVVAIAIGGVVFWKKNAQEVTGTIYRKETMALADAMVKDITQDWDPERFSLYAHPDLRVGLSSMNMTIKDVMETFATLGPRQEFKWCEHVWEKLDTNTPNEEHALVSYRCAITTPQSNEVIINMMLRKRVDRNDGQSWRIVSFQLNSPFLDQQKQ